MKRIVAVAVATALMVSLAALPARANEPQGSWAAPGSGVTFTPTAPSARSAPAAVRPSTAPRGVRGKLIVVSRQTQRLTAYELGRVVMQFKISTGRAGHRTPGGKFRVRAKGMRWWSRKWKVWMPYAMNFHLNYNLHSLPHKAGSTRLIGASQLGTPVSAGCVRIGPADARRLYAWTPVGTPVWIT